MKTLLLAPSLQPGSALEPLFLTHIVSPYCFCPCFWSCHPLWSILFPLCFPDHPSKKTTSHDLTLRSQVAKPLRGFLTSVSICNLWTASMNLGNLWGQDQRIRNRIESSITARCKPNLSLLIYKCSTGNTFSSPWITIISTQSFAKEKVD